MSKPTLAVTLGDVAGIGPEIVAKTLLNHPELREICIPVVIGDGAAIERGIVEAGIYTGKVRKIEDVSEAKNDPNLIEYIQCGDPLPEIKVGEVSAVAGDGSYRFVVEACRLGREGKVQGIVTAPLNKEAMHLGGHMFPGHTEILANEFYVKNYSMILSAGNLYVFHLSTHIALKDVSEACSTARTKEVITLAGAIMRALGRPEGKIAVCGVNPHAGENGLFGREEIEQMVPAVEEAKAEGINVFGPLPADAVFPQAVSGRWDVVIAAYHDQGHAPFKAVYGADGVNITAGLPVVRVSVDHGTGFDIAGKGVANESSLVLSCQRAAELGPGWREVYDLNKE